jgi:hypothetical protein
MEQLWRNYRVIFITIKIATISTILQIQISRCESIQFNAIIRWLLEIHGPLREYVKRNEVNPWYNCDVERAIVERDIAYKV